MMTQEAISVKVAETDAAVMNHPGVVALAGLAQRLGALDDLNRLLPPNERARGFAHSPAVFDLMNIAWSGESCIDELAQLRQDRGLTRLLGRDVMAPSTAHEHLRRIRYDGLDALATVRRRLLARMAKSLSVTTATLDCDASLFVSGGRDARMSYKGERGYMPMLAFWEELGVLVHNAATPRRARMRWSFSRRPWRNCPIPVSGPRFVPIWPLEPVINTCEARYSSDDSCPMEARSIAFAGLFVPIPGKMRHNTADLRRLEGVWE